MGEFFYSVRMRATLEGKHVSGQERIVKEEDLEKVLIELHRRPKGDWDFQSIKVERLKKEPIILEYSLPVKNYRFACVPLAHNFIVGLLEAEHSISRSVVKPLLAKLVSGIKEGKENLPGALVVDPKTGKVLNENPEKGIRTILFDWQEREKIKKKLLNAGFTERTLDALALATKNVYCGVEAEICISDDPSYITGYLASPKLGYVRITPLKEKGNPFGGRIYFVREENLSKTLKCLRELPILIKEAGI